MNLAQVLETPLTKPQLARCLRIGPRQVENLLVQGLPHERTGGRVLFRWEAAFGWYLEFKAKASKGRPAAEEAARDRLELAKAKLAEIELARAERTLVPVADVVRLWGDQVAAVSGKLSAAPSKYATRVLGLETVGQAQKALDALVQEALGELQAVPEVGDE